MDKFSELKATVPVNVKNREAVSAGFVTHDNTGGYFVIECQECGAVYPSQQADGGGQIADTGDYDDAICPHCGEESPEECENVGLAWNVQQAKITVLLAELEAKDKRIGELEFIATEYAGKFQKAQDALKYTAIMSDEDKKKIAELERILDGVTPVMIAGGWTAKGISDYAKSLEAKLATPVRLSQRYETAGYCIDEHYCQEAADGDYLDRDELIASLHEQGFTVEGDE